MRHFVQKGVCGEHFKLIPPTNLINIHAAHANESLVFFSPLSPRVIFRPFVRARAAAARAHRKSIRSSERALSCVVHAWKLHRQCPEITPAIGGEGVHLQPWFILICPVMCESVCMGRASRTAAVHSWICMWVVHVSRVEAHQADGFITGFSLLPVRDCVTDWPPTGMHMYSEIRLLCCRRWHAALLAPFCAPSIWTIPSVCLLRGTVLKGCLSNTDLIINS